MLKAARSLNRRAGKSFKFRRRFGLLDQSCIERSSDQWGQRQPLRGFARHIGPKPNIAVTGGNLSDDNRAYGPPRSGGCSDPKLGSRQNWDINTR
jgi:hypothetical protein